jgi:hypothetical protein
MPLAFLDVFGALVNAKSGPNNPVYQFSYNYLPELNVYLIGSWPGLDRTLVNVLRKISVTKNGTLDADGSSVLSS